MQNLCHTNNELEDSISYNIACALDENTDQPAYTLASQKHAYIDPLKPHFYIVKLGLTRVYIIFLFLLKKK